MVFGSLVSLSLLVCVTLSVPSFGCVFIFLELVCSKGWNKMVVQVDAKVACSVVLGTESGQPLSLCCSSFAPSLINPSFIRLTSSPFSTPLFWRPLSLSGC